VSQALQGLPQARHTLTFYPPPPHLAIRRGAKFFKADLQDADFTDANLSNASIENAKLSGVKLTNAILKNAYTGVGLELVKDFTNSGV
jgi:uncharacterized protein YjbI with pentapeptide repeats